MTKWLMIAMMLVAGAVHADTDKSNIFVGPDQMMAGDFTTRILVTAGDDTAPFLQQDLSFTAAVLPDLEENTASAVTFRLVVPNNYRKNAPAKLYAIGKPAAADTTVQLRAHIQNQGSIVNPLSTTVTAVTIGDESAVLAAGDIDNLNKILLPNSALSSLKANDQLGIYLERSSGTGENFELYGVLFQYTSEYFGNR